MMIDVTDVEKALVVSLLGQTSMNILDPNTAAASTAARGLVAKLNADPLPATPPEKKDGKEDVVDRSPDRGGVP